MSEIERKEEEEEEDKTPRTRQKSLSNEAREKRGKVNRSYLLFIMQKQQHQLLGT